MKIDQLHTYQGTSLSRRVIVRAGAKLAYAAPIIAASMQMGGRGVAALSGGQSFMVPANAEAGINTGIAVAQDQEVCVSASGTVQLCTNDNGRNFCPTGPAGDNDVCSPYPVPCCGDFVCGLLLGEVNGIRFALGAGGCATAPASGTLSLVVSDCPGCFGDNSGSYIVTITV